MCTSCRPHVDIYKKGEGSGSCGRMWTEGRQKSDSFVDVINVWPLKGIFFVYEAAMLPYSQKDKYGNSTMQHFHRVLVVWQTTGHAKIEWPSPHSQPTAENMEPKMSNRTKEQNKNKSYKQI